MDKKKKNIIFGITLYIAFTLVSFIVFTSLMPSSNLVTTPFPEDDKGRDQRTLFDDKLPKTEECPLNGAKFSKQQKKWWEQHRPLGIMIENHEQSRPQSGISFADVIYEAVAEGGITRFLAVFYCQDAGIVGPVRSARTYFLDFISEYADYPLYAHVGGANTSGPADALGQIQEYGWQSYNDLNQFSIGFPAFWRDYERMDHPVATEHTMYSATEKLWETAEKRKLNAKDKDGNGWDADFVKYSFKEDAKENKRALSQKINFNFWEGYSDYSVEWNYDKASNVYLRSNGGKAHFDKNTDKQMSANNIIVLFMRESRANDGYEGNLHMLYGTRGKGKAIIFQDGGKINGTWSKKDRASRLSLYDETGQEIKLNRGLIWFEILGIGAPVVVK